MSRFALIRRGRGLVPAILFDTSIGNGVAADGLANLPLRVGSKRLFVNSSTGSDSHNATQAQDPATPMATIAGAAGHVDSWTGSGDQIMIAEGTTYSESLPNISYKYGFSALYPLAIQSYDPADPHNEAKHGRATANRPVVGTGGVAASVTSAGDGGSYYAIRGLDFDPGNIADQGLGFVGPNSYILIENNILRYSGLSFDAWEGTLNQKHVIRRNSIYGPWSPSSHVQGVYDDKCGSLVVEDNIFWHIGWKVGASRDAATADGGATIFRHCVYQQNNEGNSCIVRRNIFIDPSATGGSLRGDVNAYDNLAIRCPLAFSIGQGNDYNTANPDGVLLDLGHNMIIVDQDITSSEPRGIAFNAGNGKSGSSIHHNIIARSRDMAGTNVRAFTNSSGYADKPSYMLYDSNIVYQWGNTLYEAGGAHPEQVFSTFTNNVWDAATSGSNVNHGEGSFADPLTLAELVTGLGFADEATMIATLIDAPELVTGVVTQAKALMAAGYAFSV